jgi:hypothetical protein
VPLLVSREYRIEDCFRRPDGFSGCAYPIVPFSWAAVPAMLGPLVVLALLFALAVIAWRAEDAAVVRMSAALAVLLGGAPLLGIGWALLAPPLLLVAAALLATRIPARAVAIDLALAAAFALVAFGGTYAAVMGLLLRGIALSSIVDQVWLYVGFATALGAALGIFDAERDRRLPLARGLCCAYAGAGIGLVAAALLLIRPALYPDGRYVNPGIGGLYIVLLSVAAAGVVSGMLALRLVLRQPWSVAVLGAFGAAGAFPLFVAATLVFGSFAPASALGPPLPPLHMLPGTSTTD